jgi:hypothetical protein
MEKLLDYASDDQDADQSQTDIETVEKTEALIPVQSSASKQAQKRKREAQVDTGENGRKQLYG